MTSNGKIVAGGCAALIGYLAIWIACISFIVWLVTSIVVSVIS